MFYPLYQDAGLSPKLHRSVGPPQVSVAPLGDKSHLDWVVRMPPAVSYSHFQFHATNGVKRASATEAMRGVLVDRARRQRRVKHGGDFQRVDLHDSAVSSGCTPDEILIVNELFDLLAEKHPAEAKVATLRYFAGFNNREAAESLEIPVSTAHSHWTFAKAWLLREYRKEE